MAMLGLEAFNVAYPERLPATQAQSTMAPKRKAAAPAERMEGQDTLDLIHVLAKTSTSHDDEQRYKVHKLACVPHDFFGDEVKRAVRRADVRPIL